MRTLAGGFFSDLIEHLGDGKSDDVGSTYEGEPLGGPLQFADFKPGGKYFPYAAIGGAALVALLVIQFSRR